MHELNSTDLIKEMRDWGVVVYLIGPADASRRLVEEAGWDFWIQWSPPVARALSVSDYLSSLR